LFRYDVVVPVAKASRYKPEGMHSGVIEGKRDGFETWNVRKYVPPFISAVAYQQ